MSDDGFKKSIRDVFKATREGETFMDVDYNALEQAALAKALEHVGVIHDETASNVPPTETVLQRGTRIHEAMAGVEWRERFQFRVEALQRPVGRACLFDQVRTWSQMLGRTKRVALGDKINGSHRKRARAKRKARARYTRTKYVHDEVLVEYLPGGISLSPLRGREHDRDAHRAGGVSVSAEDYVLGCLVAIVVALAALLIAVVGYEIWWRSGHECTHTHVATMPATTTFIPAGKALIPIFHPPYDYDECDTWVEKP